MIVRHTGGKTHSQSVFTGPFLDCRIRDRSFKSAPRPPGVSHATDMFDKNCHLPLYCAG